MSIFSRFKKIPAKLASLNEKSSSRVPDAPPTQSTSDAKIPQGNAVSLVRVIRRPLITERTTALTRMGKYTFEVAPNANKITVKRAIALRYRVHPVSVNLMNVGGRVVRFGRTLGRQKNWKKAIVTLKPGETIKEFSQT